MSSADPSPAGQGLTGDLLAPPSALGRRRLLVRMALSCLVVIVLVVSLHVDVRAVLDRSLVPLWLLIGFSLLFAQTSLAAVRWHVVLRGLELRATFRDAYRVLMIGLFFNQALPSSIGGDAVRIWEVRRLGNGGADVTTSVLLDRLIALLALLPLALIGVLRLADKVDGDQLVATVAVVSALTLLGGGVLLSLHRLPNRLLVGRLYAIRTISAGALRFLRSPVLVAQTTLASVLIHVITGITVYSLARGLSVDVSISDCILLTPLVLLVITVPVSFAGWGLREGAMVVVLGRVGVTQGDALALSVAFGLAVAVTGLPGGLLWLLARRTRGATPEGGPPTSDQSELTASP